MSNLKRPLPVSTELREQLQGHLDDLVKAGEVELPPGKRIRLSREGIPKVVEIPIPAISKQRIHQLYSHTVSYPFTRSAQWGSVQAILSDLMHDKRLRATYTHINILDRIEAVQKHVVEDFEALLCLAQELKTSPAIIQNTTFAVGLPLLVSRIINEGCQYPIDQVDVDLGFLQRTLRRNCRGVFLLLDDIRQSHEDARRNVRHEHHFGQLAAHCLLTLVAALASWDPRNDMDHEVFRSLRERVDGIRRGNREASPEIEEQDEVDDEAKVETETESEDESEGEGEGEDADESEDESEDETEL